MHTLVVSATEMEISPFRKLFPGQELCITGVGMVACMYTLLKKFSEEKYDLAIQAGIAGSFEKDWSTKPVIVSTDRFADIGVYQNDTLQNLQEAGISNFEKPYNGAGWLINPHESLLNKFELHQVKGITVNLIGEMENLNLAYQHKWSPHMETMEGAAFHFCCLAENIPFLQLRSASNIVGERDKTKWKIAEAIQQLNTALADILESIER
ncbi:MAG: futalosine hydrolase [Ferruginibacter sp.]